MANTYTLIASNTLSSSAASVTFSSIPQTYTDLVLRISARIDQTGQIRTTLVVLPNSETTSSTNGSRTNLFGTNATATSNRSSNTVPFAATLDYTAASATANTFGSGEIYFPNYAGSANKVASVFGASENNTANDPLVGVQAHLYSSTNAISSLTIQAQAGSFNLLSGSSFFLYGIKNS